jgi:phage protein D
LAVNNPDAGGIVRKPRARLKANGVIIPAWEDISVVNNPGHFVSDTFTATLPLYGLPSDMGLAWWSTQTDVEFEIAIGLADDSGNLGSLSTVIIGIVDQVDVDPMKGRISITGRDYTGALIESSTTDIYLNQTASEAAKQIAAAHGLQAEITDTTSPIGRAYGDPNATARLTRRENEWDFLTGLAEQEGFRVFMKGKTLYFGPPPTPDTSNPFAIKAQVDTQSGSVVSNATSLSLQRSLTLARDVDVYVMSADRNTGGSVEGHAHAVNPLRGSRNGAKVTAQNYQFIVPNLAQDQAQQLAEAKLRQITQQERVITATLPGDPTLTGDTVIKLTGTGTDFDQLYYLDRLQHALSFRRGYAMTIRAKNHSTYSQYE